jgi:hypothetical protein
MGVVLYGPAAIEFLEDVAPDQAREYSAKEWFEDGPGDVGGVEVDDYFGPIVHCAGDGCDSRVRFDWRHDRQLCDACGGPPVQHGPRCDVAVLNRLDAACDCGAR